MVVLAASIVTKAGKPVISRQFREVPKARIESLLASFPKLIPPNSQHTSVETQEVRYVYQPLEELYILLITNKASNILQDIDTLHLFARVVSDICKSAEEKEILIKSFELLGAFDEIVSLGFREKINLTQVRSVLEMESHEEKIQMIIDRNKEAEAKEELKRRMKQLEIQKREQQRRAAQGLPPADFGTNSGGFGTVSNSGGYSSVPRYDTSSYQSPRTESPTPSKPAKAPAFKGKAMKLGATKKLKEAEVLGALGGELSTPDLSRAGTPNPPAPSAPSRPAALKVQPKSIHITVKEQLAIRLSRDSSIQSLDLKGDLQLQLSSEAPTTPIRIKLTEPAHSTSDLQFKQHPKVAKIAPSGERFIEHKEKGGTFPSGQPLALLRWRLTKKDESWLPISINCWPTPSNDGSCDMLVEFEVEHDRLALHDFTISIPFPTTRPRPNVTSHTIGTYQVNPTSNTVDWHIDVISAEEGNTVGSLEFNVPDSAEDMDAFFPVSVNFVASGSVAGVGAESVLGNGDEVYEFSQDRSVEIEEFLIG